MEPDKPHSKKDEEELFVQRFCVLNDNIPGILAAVSMVFVDNKLNIEQQVTKSWGNKGYEIYDVLLPKNVDVSSIVEQIQGVPGVFSCELGHFSFRNASAVNHATERLCIVNKNVPGVIGSVAALLNQGGFNVLSQISQNKGGFGFTMLDIEFSVTHPNISLEALQEEVMKLNDVLSCDLKNFAPGSLYKLELLEKQMKKGKNTFQKFPSADNVPEAEDGDSGYETESESEEVSITSELVRKDSTKLSNILTKTLVGLSSFSNKVSISRNSNKKKAKELTSQGAEILPDEIENNVPFPVKISGPVKETPIQRVDPEVGVVGDYYAGSKDTLKLSAKNAPMIERKQLTQINNAKLVLAMVGLPCRGKSFTARKLEQFLNWKCVKTKIFNAGKYRRDNNNEQVMNQVTVEDVKAGKIGVNKHRADFFDSNNLEGNAVRNQAATDALKDLLKFLVKGGDVGIFDATNSVKSRRQQIINLCKNIANVVFVEVICDDKELLEENYLIKVQNSPDFLGMGLEEAKADLKRRVENYERAYETIDENENISYIKLYNLSSKMLIKGVYGRMTRSVVPYLSSLHVGSRSVILVRAGLGETVSTSPRTLLGRNTKFSYKNFNYKPTHATSYSPLDESGKVFAERLSLWLKTMIFMRNDGDVPFFDNRPDLDSFGEQKLILKDSNDRSFSFVKSNSIVDDSMADGNINSAEYITLADKFNKSRNELLIDNIFRNIPAAHSKPRSNSTEKVRLDTGAINKIAEIKVMTSTLNRSIETAEIAIKNLGSNNTVEPVAMLNPINRGKFTNLGNDELKKKFPEFWEEYNRNPFYARFPGGESYYDIVSKLEPVIIDIEQQTAPVLIVGHISSLQVLLAYFKKIPVHESMNISVPLHTVIELQPLAGGNWRENRYSCEDL